MAAVVICSIYCRYALRLKQSRREIRHQQHDAESSHRGSSFPMISLLLVSFAFVADEAFDRTSPTPPAPTRSSAHFPPWLRLRAFDFAFLFWASSTGYGGHECDGAPPCLASSLVLRMACPPCGTPGTVGFGTSMPTRRVCSAKPGHRSPHGQSVNE